MFSGRWEATAPLTATFLDGRPWLDLGHFGPEITGVVEYNDPTGLIPQEDCECAFVDDGSVDLDRKTFVATTSRCGAPTLIWSLALTEDGDGNPLLDGTVGTSGGEPIDITFTLEDTFVPDDFKICDPKP
ncbi:MAG: hypothetical protein U1F43_32140 [Myxococcota bacterium]